MSMGDFEKFGKFFMPPTLYYLTIVVFLLNKLYFKPFTYLCLYLTVNLTMILVPGNGHGVGVGCGHMGENRLTCNYYLSSVQVMRLPAIFIFFLLVLLL